MARQRQGQPGGRAPRSLWERAGERAGDGAGALFARLDAQDALDAQEASEGAGDPGPAQDFQAAQMDTPARERAAATLERLAARIRAGSWSADLAALVTLAERALAGE